MDKNVSKLRKNSLHYSHLGFTLIECLFALFLLSIICMLFSATINNAASVTKHLKSEQEKEWHIFLIQFENELKNCRYENTQAHKIILRNKKNNKSVWIEHKLGKIVKVDNGGYHPLLIGVKHAKFIEQDQFIVLKITFENNVIFTAKWIITQEHKDE